MPEVRLADIPNIKIEHFTNNCTLVAVKEVSGASDRVILDLFQKRGYIPHHGTRDVQYMGVLTDLGIRWEEVKTGIDGRTNLVWGKTACGSSTLKWNSARFMTLKQFCVSNPEGVFVVRGNGHAWVVRDGRVIDPNVASQAKKKLSRRVEAAWRILNPASSTYAEKVGAETYKLRRGDDPIVRFRYFSTFRRKGTKCYDQELEARRYINLNNRSGQGMKLSKITANTSYNRSIAAWDLKHGHLEVVKGE